MNVDVQPGKYVLAVSGGVDSVALLDILRQRPGIKLVVAHFDHGIRHDSEIDRLHVQQIAERHGLPFVYHEAKLGPGTSEETARKARYEFLHHVRQASGAKAVITAHHHDDAMETAILNLLRGTNRKGLSSLQSQPTVHRPMLRISKNEIRQYALDQGLQWREDSTNTDTALMRNYVRHKIMPRLEHSQRQKLKDILVRMSEINRQLDESLLHFFHVQSEQGVLDRKTFIQLPHPVAREVIAAWLRNHGLRDFDQKTIERIVVNAKTLVPGKTIDVIKGHSISITKNHLRLAK